MGAHAPCRSVAPFNGRCIGRGIPQLLQDALDATLGAMSVANVNLHHALSFALLDDLHMSQCPGNPVAQVRKTPPLPLATGAIGLSENLRKQASLAGFAICEQDQAMTIGKALSGIL